jgi:hypothetical protein
MKEIWKDIEGYVGLYQVSNLGRVRRTRVSAGARIKTLVPFNRVGYLAVGLHKNGKRVMFYTHRLVAQAFIKNPRNKVQINHKDGNKQNNKVSNLEWVTPKENTQHAISSLGVDCRCIGENNGQTKLTETFVRQIKESRLSVKELAKIYKVGLTTMYNIKNNRSWKHVVVLNNKG